MSHPLRSVLVPLAALTLSLGLLQAQNTRPAPPPPPGALPVPPEMAGPRLDFNFDRLPLEEVIRQVQSSYHTESGKYLNVMIPENLSAVAATNLINLEIKQVTVSELFDLLSRASQRRVKTMSNTGRLEEVSSGYRFEPVSVSGGTLTYLLQGNYPVESVLASSPEPVIEFHEPSRNFQKDVQFFQLDPYLDRFTVDDITTAIKIGWDLAGYTPSPTMKYHEETKLLVFHGTQSEILVIQGVLQGIANVRRPDGDGASAPMPPTSLPRPINRQAIRVPTQPDVPLPPQPAKP